MANPTPSHNPTDALGTAVVIELSGTGVTNITGNEYTVQLSVSATGFPATCTLTAVLEDAADATFTSGNSNVVNYISYNNPGANSAVSQNPNIASVGITSGVITALNPGQAVIEARFATTDENVNSNSLLPGFIYATVLVVVGP
jgi:hypothetical protein